MKNLSNIHQIIGKNVKCYRESKNISQISLANSIGHETSTIISSAENYVEDKQNQKKFNIEQLIQIAKVLDCDIVDFFKTEHDFESKTEVIFQGLENNFMLDSIKELLSSDLDNFIISSAYLNSYAVELLSKELSNVKDKLTLYIGINNGTTTYQSIIKLFELELNIYLIDTGSISKIFHPKMYLGYNKNKAILSIGSSNLTTPGLTKNIELNSVNTLNLSNSNNMQILSNLLRIYDDLGSKYNANTIHIDSVESINTIFNDGKLIDEKVQRENFKKESLRTTTVKNKSPKIKTFEKKIHRVTTNSTQNNQQTKTILGTSEFVWASNPLTRRDLTIPISEGTNSTGSMLFKKGQLKDIDQRVFFIEKVFNNLTWVKDPNPNKSHYLRSNADFDVIIDGINYGTFNLLLSHNTQKGISWKQKNSMTQVSWGKQLKPIIAKEEHIGSILKLYKKGNGFLIKIEKE